MDKHEVQGAKASQDELGGEGERERDGRRKGERGGRLLALEVTLDLWPKGCGPPL